MQHPGQGRCIVSEEVSNVLLLVLGITSVAHGQGKPDIDQEAYKFKPVDV